MMGLEKFLRGLYGTEPQIDMDRQIARARVPRPMRLDFAALADGIKRANVGTAGILVVAIVETKQGFVRFQATGQSFPLKGPAGQEGEARRLSLRVLDWELPDRTKLEIVP